MEEDKVELARQLLQEAKTHKLKFLLPVDHVIADRIDANAITHTVNGGSPIPPNMMALDIGPQTIEAFSEEISRARTIVWNGPMGVFEVQPFSKGTFKIARAIADNPGATSIVGGGDSVAAIKASGVADQVSRQPLEAGDEAATQVGGLDRLFHLLPEAFAQRVRRLGREGAVDLHAGGDLAEERIVR